MQRRHCYPLTYGRREESRHLLGTHTCHNPTVRLDLQSEAAVSGSAGTATASAADALKAAAIFPFLCHLPFMVCQPQASGTVVSHLDAGLVGVRRPVGGSGCRALPGSVAACGRRSAEVLERSDLAQVGTGAAGECEILRTVRTEKHQQFDSTCLQTGLEKEWAIWWAWSQHQLQVAGPPQ